MIVHDFSVQYAKQNFLTSDGLVIEMPDKLRDADARRAGLGRIILYGLCLEDHGMYFVRCSSNKAPLPLLEFLLEGWTTHTKGLPDVLKISPKMADQMPWLAAFCESLGVSLQIAGGKDRRYESHKRNIEQRLDWIGLSYGSQGKQNSAASIDELNARGVWNNPYAYASGKVLEKGKALEVERVKPVPKSTASEYTSHTFKPGNWMLSPQESIPPRSTKWVKEDLQARLAGKWRAEHVTEDNDDAVHSDSAPTAHESEADARTTEAHEIIRGLSANWPASRKSMAVHFGLAVAEFNWFLSGKRGLDYEVWRQIRFEYNVLASDRVHFDDGSVCYEPGANYALTIKETSLRAVTDLYTELSNGGDLAFSAEILPKAGKKSPVWRVVMFWTWGYRLVLMYFPRDSAWDKTLDKSLVSTRMGGNTPFINMVCPVEVSAGLYSSALDVQRQIYDEGSPMVSTLEAWRSINAKEMEVLERDAEEKRLGYI